MNDLQFTLREVGATVILALLGEIEIYNTGAVKGEVKRLIENKKVRLVINMEGVPFIDSTGIGMLLLFQRNLRAAGGALKLTKITPAVEKVFRLTKLMPILEIFDSEEAAMASFR